jgi:hypothetical protein
VQRGPSAHVEGARGSTGGSGSNIGPSALGCRIVRAPRGLSAGASWTVRACRAQVGPGSQVVSQQAGLLSSQTRTKHPLPLFLLLSLSLSRKGLLLGVFIWGTPRTVRAHPRTLCEVLHHVIRVFFQITHSISRILSKKVVRVSCCDLKIVHGFKFLAW